MSRFWSRQQHADVTRVLAGACALTDSRFQMNWGEGNWRGGGEWSWTQAQVDGSVFPLSPGAAASPWASDTRADKADMFLSFS